MPGKEFKLEKPDDLRNYIIMNNGALMDADEWMNIPAPGTSKTEDADFEIINPKALKMEKRIYKGLVLNNYGEGRNYADMIKEGIKNY